MRGCAIISQAIYYNREKFAKWRRTENFHRARAAGLQAPNIIYIELWIRWAKEDDEEGLKYATWSSTFYCLVDLIARYFRFYSVVDCSEML